ncbi:hypothetical protein RxyAA322_15740 [Rubrobacter xylanophilus]|uniref:Uncharacterized protein n=1 Tax=Rubrobacter xylanophilus TaxID=49319 RepID=A0A510HIA3_9ACTN|nr:hypothetical protein [Rubrobacter xylanophilus]BBL79720.1 hypothetical protein RxyAA322_15740 [Rubrobacter xylanophilus]
MRKTALYGTLAAVAVTAGNVLHGVSHAGAEVPLAAWQRAYVYLVIFLAPVVAAVLLWGRFRRAGAWLLAVSMAGSLVFGVANHFLIPGPDNALALEPGAWQTAFRASAALLVPLDALGLAVGFWAVRGLSRAADTPEPDDVPAEAEAR